MRFVAIRCACSILSVKCERKRLCERLRCRWQHNVNGSAEGCVCVCVCVCVRENEVGFSRGHDDDDDDGAFKSVDVMKRLNEQIESCFILRPDGYYCYLGKSEQSVQVVPA